MNGSEGQLELGAEPAHDESGPDPKVEALRDSLLSSLAAGETDTVERRVATVLSRAPETRDSDIKLLLRYWEMYEDYDGGPIDPDDLFRWARLPTLIRARARIQNDFNLFQASAEIRKRRGKLSDEEYEKALEAVERSPISTIVVDESGKSGPHLIQAAVWFADGGEVFPVLRKLGQWRTASGFEDELHFKDLTEENAGRYQEAVSVFLAEASTASFKAISVPKDGVKRVDEALEELLYQLLRRGAQHEHETGRAPFPRALQVWKDRENKGADNLLLARLRDRVNQAGKTELEGKLSSDDFESIESVKSDLIQIADLFAASLNRRLNAPGGDHVKDRFSAWLLEKVGMPEGPADESTLPGDMVIHITL